MQRFRPQHAMAEGHITEEALNEIQQWAVGCLAQDECDRVMNLINEIRYLRKLVRPVSGGEIKSTARRDRPDQDNKQQCQFIRKIGGHQFRCAAAAKYGDFCGYHKPRQLKNVPKGCRVTARSGAPCMGVVLRDGLCPTHWE